VYTTFNSFCLSLSLSLTLSLSACVLGHCRQYMKWCRTRLWGTVLTKWCRTRLWGAVLTKWCRTRLWGAVLTKFSQSGVLFVLFTVIICSVFICLYLTESFFLYPNEWETWICILLCNPKEKMWNTISIET